MTESSVQLLAVEMQISVERLIQQFLDIGIVKTQSDDVSLSEKKILFKYMNYTDNSVFNQLTLQRKIRSTLNVSSIGGKSKQIQIEVRKKRVYDVQYSASQVSSKCIDVKVKKSVKSNVMSVNDKSVNLSHKSALSAHAIDDNNVVNVPVVSIQNAKGLQNFSKVVPYTYSVNKKKCHIIGKDNTRILENVHNLPQKMDVNDSRVLKNMKLATINDNKQSVVTVTTDKNDGIQKSFLDNNHERRYRPKAARIRHRIGGVGNNSSGIKPVMKQKRNNHRLLYDDIISGVDGEQESRFFNKVSKIRRKQSSLIQSFKKPDQIVVRDIIIGKTVSVSELSNKMSVKSSQVIKVMMQLGLMVTINQIIDQETAQLVAEEMGHNVILRCDNELEKLIMSDRHSSGVVSSSNAVNVEKRAPVVTVMGHVDHGKTSLLDCIRKTKVAVFEAGGITQSIGAYHVSVGKETITFIDTPGHTAFTAMRARGIKLTDIVVLVIAADDGIMPQTIEAIQHIKVVNVPVIVAINKVDKLNANPDRIKSELNNYGIVSEEWGGDTQFVCVSATLGTGIDILLDAILLQSEMLELKAVRNGTMARAVVIESFLDKGRGPVVTVLMQEGTLRCGDVILCGIEYGRVRAMKNEYGYDVSAAEPSMPVELLGLSGVPASGEMLIVVRSEKKAREVALYRQGKFREVKLMHSYKGEELNVDKMFGVMQQNVSNSIPVLNIIVKSNTKGSIEAICDALMRLSTNGVAVKIVSAAIGSITETDAVLASTFNQSIILGFNVKSDTSARRIIESNQLNVRYYSVIYDLLNEVEDMINGMLVAKCNYQIVGVAEVHNVFCFSKSRNIAGCIVTEGVIKKDKMIRVMRENVIVHEGTIESLRRFKSDVREVRVGSECGLSIKNYNDICSGDKIEVIEVITVKSQQ